MQYGATTPTGRNLPQDRPEQPERPTFGYEYLRERWDDAYIDPALNEIHNLLDEAGVRDNEERRAYLAIGMMLVHPDLDAALAWDQRRQKYSRATQAFSDLCRWMPALRDEIEGPAADPDDRIDSTGDYKAIRNALGYVCRTIEDYQQTNDVDVWADGRQESPFLVRIGVAQGFGTRGSLLDTEALAAGVSTVRHASRN